MPLYLFSFIIVLSIITIIENQSKHDLILNVINKNVANEYSYSDEL